LEENVVKQCIEEINKGFDAIVVHNSPDISVGWIARIRKFEVDMYKNDITYSAARFFKKKVFLALKGYNKALIAGEDYDIQNCLNNSNFKTGFIDAEAIHLGEPTSFWKHMLKYFNYGRDFVHYQRVSKDNSTNKLLPFRNVYFKNRKKFFNNPILGLQFIIYSIFKFISGGIGCLSAKISFIYH
jgi:hypothetical protein